MPRHARLQDGFTLIEVMITVAIIGILAAVALPSYTDYLRRGQVPEAFTYLSNDRVQMEQFYQDNRTYGQDACANGAIAATPNGSRYFAYSCRLTDDGGYVLTASSTSQMATAHEYTLDNNNVRSTTVFKGNAQTDKSCWLVKGSEC